MNKLIVLSIIILRLSLANASTQIGNGGVVVVCPPSSGRPEVEILDFVEGELLWQFQLKKEPPGLDTYAIVREHIDEIESFDQVRAARLRESLSHFMGDSFFLKNASLERTNDENYVALPAKCVIDQAVVQIQPQFAEEKRYNISDNYWTALSDRPVQQAGLIFHELIYREAIALGQTVSRPTRYFTALVFSDQFQNLSQDRYNEVLSRVGLPILIKQ